MTDHLTAEQIQNHLNGLTLEGGSVAEAVAELLKEQRNQIIEEIEGLARRYDTREMSYEAGDPVAQTYKHAAANQALDTTHEGGDDES